MPIPLAAGNISALVLLHARAGIVEPGPRPLVLVVVLVLSALMISGIHYPAFKKTSPRQTTATVILLAALSLIAAFKTGFALMFSLVIFTVSLIGPGREVVVFLRRLRRPHPAIEKDRIEPGE